MNDFYGFLGDNLSKKLIDRQPDTPNQAFYSLPKLINCKTLLQLIEV